MCAGDFENIKSVYSELSRVMKSQGIFFSFCYSVSHIEFIKASFQNRAKKLTKGTFSNFKAGDFKGVGSIHFFSIDEILYLAELANFKVLSISELLIKDMYSFLGLGRAEYAIVMQKL